MSTPTHESLIHRNGQRYHRSTTLQRKRCRTLLLSHGVPARTRPAGGLVGVRTRGIGRAVSSARRHQQQHSGCRCVPLGLFRTRCTKRFIAGQCGSSDSVAHSRQLQDVLPTSDRSFSGKRRARMPRAAARTLIISEGLVLCGGDEARSIAFVPTRSDTV